MSSSYLGRLAICLVAAAVSSALATKIASGYAGMHAVNCVPDSPSSIAIVNNGQIEAKTTTNLYCPVSEDASFEPCDRNAHVVVNGWANRYATTWQACETNSWGSGGSCGAITSAVSGIYNLSVPLGLWASCGNYHYLQGNLIGPDASGSFNTFFGYTLETLPQ